MPSIVRVYLRCLFVGLLVYLTGFGQSLVGEGICGGKEKGKLFKLHTINYILILAAMEIKRGIISGLSAGIVMGIVGCMVGGLLWMALWGGTPPGLPLLSPVYILSVLIGIGAVFGIIFGLIYTILYPSLRGKGTSKGLFYGFLIWIFSSLLVTAYILAGLSVPPELIPTMSAFELVYGIITWLVYGAILGFVYEKIPK